MTRDEHLNWARRRALEYLPEEPWNASASMISDMKKHPELRDHVGLQICPLFYGRGDDPTETRNWIEGFN